MDSTLMFTVTNEDTAIAVGSGSLPVLGTPRLLAWCEAATCAAIDPTAHGRGVGRALLELTVERFRADGARAVVLGSLEDMHAAHRLYERAGFVRVPARDWEPEPGVQLLCFRLPLTTEEP